MNKKLTIVLSLLFITGAAYAHGFYLVLNNPTDNNYLLRESGTHKQPFTYKAQFRAALAKGFTTQFEDLGEQPNWPAHDEEIDIPGHMSGNFTVNIDAILKGNELKESTLELLGHHN